jgi:DNA-binding beta-propeller fold protein YncE
LIQRGTYSEKERLPFPPDADKAASSILEVTGVGKVSATGTSIKIWPRRGTGGFFGVDTMALDPSENYLYVTNPTDIRPINDVALIDLTTNTQVGYIPGHNIPTGIAFATIMSDGE